MIQQLFINHYHTNDLYITNELLCRSFVWAKPLYISKGLFEFLYTWTTDKCDYGSKTKSYTKNENFIFPQLFMRIPLIFFVFWYLISLSWWRWGITTSLSS